jgi:hypothetical protein
MTIKSIKHAAEVQNRRFNSGRRGISKAVRRFMYSIRVAHDRRPWNGYKLLANFDSCSTMKPNTSKPANWS